MSHDERQQVVKEPLTVLKRYGVALRMLTCAALLSASATSAQASAQLYVFDSKVIDINPGAASSNPEQQGFKRLGSHLYFVADDGVHGRELWRTDGVTAELVADINPGPSGSEIYLWGAKSYGGRLYFSANDGVHGNEPWWTDGVTTEMLMDTRLGADSGGYATGFTEHLGWLYFDVDNGVTRQLWRTDGASTAVLIALNAADRLGFGCFSFQVKLFCIQRLTLYLINDLSSAEVVGTIGDWGPTQLDGATWLIPARDKMSVFDGSTMRQLSQAPGLRYQPEVFTTVSFKGRSYTGSNIGLLRFSRTHLERFGTQFNYGAVPLVVLGGWLYFHGDDGTKGAEVWRTNGTVFRLVGELNKRTTGMNSGRGIGLNSPMLINGYLYFVASINPNTGETGFFRTKGVGFERVKYGNAQLDCKLCGFWGEANLGSTRVGAARTQSYGNELGFVDLTKISTDRRASAKVKPSITGTARVGEVLTAGTGRWDGHPRVSTTVQWYACSLSVAVPRTTLPTGCKKVSGATNPTLLITEALRGKHLLLAVTAKSARTAATVWTSKTTVKVP
jgi:ELWxxDGT repeat protein